MINSLDSDINSSINESPNKHCTEHSKTFKFICYQCNQLLCSKCLPRHLADLGIVVHKIDHVDNIKSQLSFLESKDNNNNKDENNNNNSNSSVNDSRVNFIKKQIDNIWNTVKVTTNLYQSLSVKEKDISLHFTQLHDQLMIEEHKIKKPIVNDMEELKHQIENNINEMKSLFNIIDLSNKLYNQNHTSPQNSNNSDINDDHLSDDTTYDQPDTTEKYQIESIMKSIKESLSLDQFVGNNSETLFYKDKLLLDNVNSNNNSTSKDLFLLDLINNHNKQFQTSIISINNNNNNSNNSTSLSNRFIFSDYKLVINKDELFNYRKMIERSIYLSTYQIPKNTFILSTQKEGGAVLIDLTPANNFYKTETIRFEFDSFRTWNSLVRAGDYIFIFGSNSSPNKFCRYSIPNKIIDRQSDIVGVDGGRGISVCYDGQDHIYLINGYNSKSQSFNHRIDRFNINTLKFEKYFQLENLKRNHLISFFYHGLLYSIALLDTSLYIFDPQAKKMTTYINEIFLKSYVSCTDGIGNIYIHTNNEKFYRINVDTKEITYLAKSIGPISNSMLYHKVSNSESFIYLLGGKARGNYIYSIEKDSWSKFFSDDDKDRYLCGSIIFSINQ